MDIIERLRIVYELPRDKETIDYRWLLSDRTEAADEIQRLRARLDSAQKQEPVAVRIEPRAGRYLFMESKHWNDNKGAYEGMAVDALGVIARIQGPLIDEEYALIFPSIIEQKLLAPPLLTDSHGIYHEGGAEMAQEMQRMREVIDRLKAEAYE